MQWYRNLERRIEPYLIKQKHCGRILFGFALIGVVEVWLAVLWWLPRHYSPDDAGLLGDSFGIITSLFSGLTMIGAGYAVYAQAEQLRLTRKQVEESKELSVLQSLMTARVALSERSDQRVQQIVQKFKENGPATTSELIAHRKNILHPFRQEDGRNVSELKRLVVHLEQQIGWQNQDEQDGETDTL